MHRVADPMIGDAVLAEVVGPDLLGAFAGAHLGLPVLGDGIVLLLHLEVVETRSQHLHRLCAILDL